LNRYLPRSVEIAFLAALVIGTVVVAVRDPALFVADA
jgi:hypothetical protein